MSLPNHFSVILAVVPSALISAIALFHISNISESSFLTAPPTPSPKTPPKKPKQGPGYTMFQHTDKDNHDTPPDKEGIKEVTPELTDPIKPNCECFDSQTEIYLDSNAYVWKNIYSDIKLLKKKIKEASEQVGKNLDLINENKEFSERMCCASNLPNRCKELEYDCEKQVKLP